MLHTGKSLFAPPMIILHLLDVNLRAYSIAFDCTLLVLSFTFRTKKSRLAREDHGSDVEAPPQTPTPSRSKMSRPLGSAFVPAYVYITLHLRLNVALRLIYTVRSYLAPRISTERLKMFPTPKKKPLEPVQLLRSLPIFLQTFSLPLALPLLERPIWLTSRT